MSANERELIEAEREQRVHAMNLQNGHADINPHEIYESMLEDIVKTSLKESSKEMLKNLLSRDFVLAYLTGAELNEFKWKLRLKRELFYAMHPDHRCAVVGDVRKFVNDDAGDTLAPIPDEVRWEVENVFDGVWMRATRSHNGKQWDAINTQIRESRLGGEGRDSGRGGLIGWIKG